jgi:excinuclease ABC subunit A
MQIKKVKNFNLSNKIEDLNPRDYILVKGAEQNNLKKIDLAIPQKKFVVITGLSGSGKSSLAFDTLYAEGQRRYVESLSSYIRQFMGKIDKPKVEYIKGLSPAIAIQQKVNTSNPRSTVGTSTEIYDYLRLLYAKIGVTYSPVSGNKVTKHTVEDVVSFISNLEENTKIQIITKIKPLEGRDWKQELTTIVQKGFNRLIVNNQIVRLDGLVNLLENESNLVELENIINFGEKEFYKSKLLIDRVSANKEKENLSRIADSVQTAFYEGGGIAILQIFKNADDFEEVEFNDRFELDGITFEEPSVNLFTFNNPYGACKKCEGFGTTIDIDESKVIPNPNLSVFDDTVACWKGEAMSEWKFDFIRTSINYDFPIHRAYEDLSEKEKDLLWNGNKVVPGIYDFFKHIETQTYKIQYRVMLARFKGKALCRECKGSRLRNDVQYVKINGKSIGDLVNLPCVDLANWFNNIELDEYQLKVAGKILTEIQHRLKFLNEVGLGYLTLNRESRTLSGGESQRIQIVSTMGSPLTGSLYILDEPSIGLHSYDTDRLIKVLKNLQKAGNSVIVVEHDEDVIRSADYIIDIGPLAGVNGGEVVFEGDFEKMENESDSLTTKYLKGELKVVENKIIRKKNRSFSLNNVSANNLKNISVEIPLNMMVVVTGLSGSGKSTLVKEALVPTLRTYIEKKYTKNQRPSLSGDWKKITRVEYIDQDPIGKSSRSNPVTYLKAFDGIRELFASQLLAKHSGLTASNFSFNIDGGRCDVCKGEGTITIEMQFMADIQVICDNCKGKRYKQSILDITYKDKNIADVLNLTVEEALAFFSDKPNIYESIYPLHLVGLDYVALGQPSIYLSGGEAQRIKLSTFLQKSNSTEPILFVFDEPTTGLHFHDIKTLLKAFDALIEKGHSLVVIEHNIDIIKASDWIIDLGPGAGNDGGTIVFQGPINEIKNMEESITAKYI